MKQLKIFSILVCITVLLAFPVTVYAASQTRAYTYNFKHQVAVNGSYKANKSTAVFWITTTSNSGNDEYFTVKQYKYKFWGANTYQGEANISCVANSSDTCSLNTTKGTVYTYEFWKPTAIGYVALYGRIVVSEA